MSDAVPEDLRSELPAPLRDIPPVVRALLVLALLYTFLVGIGLLEEGISALGSGF